MDEEENIEALLEAFSSKTDIETAMEEKSEAEPLKNIGETVKTYPKPQRELDLHGKTVEEAKREILNFIGNAQHQRLRTVRIITGKGLHSAYFQSALPEITEQLTAKLRQEGIILTVKKEKTGGSFVVFLA